MCLARKALSGTLPCGTRDENAANHRRLSLLIPIGMSYRGLLPGEVHQLGHFPQFFLRFFPGIPFA